ncbi:MAG: hypothetical protein CL946_02300 [Ectothiorhodospiraceae bacterium]|nr:hypothetical protein [Ectothiorhodospiraceae bacterium]
MSAPVPIYLLRRGPLSPDTGGPNRVVYDLMKRCTENGDPCRVVTVNGSSTELKPPKRAPQIEANSLKQRLARGLNRFSYGLYLQLLRDRKRLLEHIAPQTTRGSVIHAHEQIAAGLVFPQLKLPKILTVHTKGSILKDVLYKVHPHIAGTWLEQHYKKIERAALRSANAVTFPSEGARKVFAEDYPDLLQRVKILRVVYNGIDVSGFAVKKHTEQEVLSILVVCALVEEKRFDRVIEIAAQLKAAGVRFIIRHAGDGPLREEYLQQIRERELGDHFELFGSLPNERIRSLLDESDLYLLPSERVIFDIATLEAMASGLPAIVSDVGGNREMLVDGESGYLIPPDEIPSFVDAITSLAGNAGLRSDIGKNARQRVEQRFSIQQMYDEYQSLYEEVYQRTRK